MCFRHHCWVASFIFIFIFIFYFLFVAFWLPLFHQDIHYMCKKAASRIAVGVFLLRQNCCSTTPLRVFDVADVPSVRAATAPETLHVEYLPTLPCNVSDLVLKNRIK